MITDSGHLISLNGRAAHSNRTGNETGIWVQSSDKYQRLIIQRLLEPTNKCMLWNQLRQISKINYTKVIRTNKQVHALEPAQTNIRDQ